MAEEEAGTIAGAATAAAEEAASSAADNVVARSLLARWTTATGNCKASPT